MDCLFIVVGNPFLYESVKLKTKWSMIYTEIEQIERLVDEMVSAKKHFIALDRADYNRLKGADKSLKAVKVEGDRLTDELKERFVAQIEQLGREGVTDILLAVNCVDVDAVEYGDMVSLLDAVVAGRDINIIWGVMEAGKGVSLYAVVGYGE